MQRDKVLLEVEKTKTALTEKQKSWLKSESLYISLNSVYFLF